MLTALISLLAATTASERAIVLTYHDMVPKRDKNALWFDCTPDELVTQLDGLKSKGATFISLKQLHDFLVNKKPLPKRPVAITFADNYIGFKMLAWPILKRKGIPVTMFIHTGHVGSKKGRPKMDWNDLRELQSNPLFTAASQTVSHPADLTRLNSQQLVDEFVRSKATLVKHLGLQFGASLLAYPNGKFNQTVATLAKQSGYSLAFTEEQQPVKPQTNRWQIPRYVHTRHGKAWADLTSP